MDETYVKDETSYDVEPTMTATAALMDGRAMTRVSGRGSSSRGEGCVYVMVGLFYDL